MNGSALVLYSFRVPCLSGLRKSNLTFFIEKKMLDKFYYVVIKSQHIPQCGIFIAKFSIGAENHQEFG
jgi:hypothetical protein